MITKINIENFSGIKSVNINITKNISLFLGENGQGKTSIKNALVWATTGGLPGLKKKNEISLVRQGSKKALVRIQLGEKIVERTRTKTRAMGEILLKEDYISICQLLWSSPWKVFNWFQGSEAKKWLAQKLNKGPTVEQLEKYIGSDLPASIKTAFLQGGLEAAYREAVSKRREAKRVFGELEKVIPPQDVFVENLKELEEKAKEYEKRIKLLKNIEMLKEEIEQEKKEELEKKLSEIREKIQKQVFICPELKKPCPVVNVTGIEIETLKIEKNKIKQKIKELKEKKDLLIQLELEAGKIIPNEKETLQEKLNDIKNKILESKVAEQMMKKYEQTQQQKKSLEQEIKIYDTLAKKLNPAEAGKVLSKGDDLEKINERLARWVQFMGFQIKINDDFELEVVDGRPVIGLSFSEIYRTGVALAETMASLCNIKILIFDDAEVLVQGTQIKFMKWLKALETEGYQILVFAASKGEPKANPAFQIVHVKAGEAVVLS